MCAQPSVSLCMYVCILGTGSKELLPSTILATRADSRVVSADACAETPSLKTDGNELCMTLDFDLPVPTSFETHDGRDAESENEKEVIPPLENQNEPGVVEDDIVEETPFPSAAMLRKWGKGTYEMTAALNDVSTGKITKEKPAESPVTVTSAAKHEPLHLATDYEPPTHHDVTQQASTSTCSFDKNMDVEDAQDTKEKAVEQEEENKDSKETDKQEEHDEEKDKEKDLDEQEQHDDKDGKETGKQEEHDEEKEKEKELDEQEQHDEMDGTETDKQEEHDEEKEKEKESEEKDVASTLPPKPADWKDVTAVTADQQQPPKPRGRKKKVVGDDAKDSENKAIAEPKQKAKAKAKSKAKEGDSTQPPAVAKHRSKKQAKQPEQYQPFEVEGNIDIDKGAAFDAYAVASAAVDIHTLTEGSNAATTAKRQAETSEAGNTTKARKTKGTASRKKNDAGDEHEEEKPAKKAKKAKKDEENEQGEASSSSKKKPAVRSAEAKAKVSRKSCAYKKAFNNALKNGVDQWSAKELAKKVTCMHFTFKLFYIFVLVKVFHYVSLCLF